jgi:hypothetical protein
LPAAGLPVVGSTTGAAEASLSSGVVPQPAMNTAAAMAVMNEARIARMVISFRMASVIR